MDTFNLIAEVGVPIAGALVMAYFIFLKYLRKELRMFPMFYLKVTPLKSS